MLEMAAAAGAIDLYYADESGCCQWTPVSYRAHLRSLELSGNLERTLLYCNPHGLFQ
jgi:hypothetical protein